MPRHVYTDARLSASRLTRVRKRFYTGAPSVEVKMINIQSLLHSKYNNTRSAGDSEMLRISSGRIC